MQFFFTKVCKNKWCEEEKALLTTFGIILVWELFVLQKFAKTKSYGYDGDGNLVSVFCVFDRRLQQQGWGQCLSGQMTPDKAG